MRGFPYELNFRPVEAGGAHSEVIVGTLGFKLHMECVSRRNLNLLNVNPYKATFGF